MALEYTAENIGIINDVYSGYAEQNVDADVTLPDYCPDILRVLKCTVEPNIISSKISGDRINIDGNALVRILYCDESGNICSYEQSYPYSKYAETGGDKTGVLFCGACVQYANCRAVNKRRLEIHSMLHLSFNICEVSRKDFIDDITTPGVETKTIELSFSDIAACESKQFPINETVQIPDDLLPVQRLISAQAVPIIAESKVIQGKCLLKGEIIVNMVYCADDNFGECAVFQGSIPFNQVIEVSGLGENCVCCTVPEIKSAEFNVRNDSRNLPRFVDVSLVVSVNVKAYCEKTAQFITDAYSTSGALEENYDNISLYSSLESINDTFVCRNTFDFSALSPEKICAVWFDDVKVKKDFSSGKINFSGTARANIILTDSDSKPVFCEREFEFEYSRTSAAAENPALTQSVVITGCTFSPLSDSSSEIKAEFSISADIFSRKNVKALSGADLLSSDSPCGRSPSIIVYFCEGDENVWDIARNYSTTTELIKKENNLTSDTVSSKGALLIPVI